MYTDTCPNNTTFWESILGDTLKHKLGLFHLIQRISKTLDPYSDLYWKCLVQLRACFYRYNHGDWERLIKALRSGAFSRQGIAMTAAEIDEIKHSKRWNQRYENFLRKEIHQGATIKQALEEWIIAWNTRSDEMGRFVFTRNTEKTTRDQYLKVPLASDVPGLQMYQEVPAGSLSSHGLSKFYSNRPESHLEQFHQWLAHYANTNSAPEFSDPINLGSIADHNIKARWKYNIKEKKLAGQIVNIPGHFEDQPLLWDHSMMSYINEVAKARGLSLVFDSVFEIGKDNGEHFLTDYYKNQVERNRRYGQHPDTKMCLCPDCRSYAPSSRPYPLETQQSVRIRDENEDRRQEMLPLKNAEVVATNRPVQMVPAPIPTPIPAPVVQYTVDYRVVSLFAQSQNCCYHHYPFYCQQKYRILLRIFWGEKIVGRHPHDVSCPTKKK